MRWLLVDRIIEMDPGKSAVGVRNFSRSESFFMDHFPGFPIVPGVLHVEMIAQVGGKCIRAFSQNIMPMLGSIKSAKFYHRIVPGDQAVIKAQVILRKEFSVVSGQIDVEGKRVSTAEMILAHMSIPDRLIGRIQEDEVMGEWLRAGNP